MAQSTNGNASTGMAESSAVSDSSTSGGISSVEVQAGVSDAIDESAGGSSVSASAAFENSIAGAGMRAMQSEGTGSYSTSVTNSLQTGTMSSSETNSLHAGRMSSSEKSELRAIQSSGLNAYRTAHSGNLPQAGSTEANVRKAAAIDQVGQYEKQPSTSVQEKVSYSEDFPDSTNGTAMPSPPDEGADSPLEWSPDIGFEFADMAQQQFLVPSLHVGLRSQKLQQREGEKRHRPRKKALSGSAPSSLLPSLPQETFESDILGQSTLPSSLDQSSINPQ